MGCRRTAALPLPRAKYDKARSFASNTHDSRALQIGRILQQNQRAAARFAIRWSRTAVRQACACVSSATSHSTTGPRSRRAPICCARTSPIGAISSSGRLTSSSRRPKPLSVSRKISSTCVRSGISARIASRPTSSCASSPSWCGRASRCGSSAPVSDAPVDACPLPCLSLPGRGARRPQALNQAPASAIPRCGWRRNRNGASFSPRIEAGTKLIRMWQDKTRTVTALADGFEWQGSRYRSLCGAGRWPCSRRTVGRLQAKLLPACTGSVATISPAVPGTHAGGVRQIRVGVLRQSRTPSRAFESRRVSPDISCCCAMSNERLRKAAFRRAATSLGVSGALHPLCGDRQQSACCLRERARPLSLEGLSRRRFLLPASTT